MDGRTRSGSVGHSRSQNRVSKEGTVGNSPIDAREVLVVDAPRAQSQVADFRVAHDACRKPHGFACSFKSLAGVLLFQTAVEGNVGKGYGVIGAGRCVPPAVQDNEGDRAPCARVACSGA